MKPTHKPLAVSQRKTSRNIVIPTRVVEALDPKEGDIIYYIQAGENSILMTLDPGASV